MTLLELLQKAGLASPALLAEIQDLETKYPDAAPAVDAVLAEVAGAFTPEGIAAIIPNIVAEAVGIKGGLKPEHHASDGGA